MNDTKHNILLAALELFARDGYEAVSVSEIAGALGMTKGALYRHYTNKRDIFESIVKEMEKRDSERANDFCVPEKPLEDTPEPYRNVTSEQLAAFCKAQFRYWTQDEFASRFRKMLTLEQFRSAEMARLYQQYLCSGPLGYTADILEAAGMKDAGLRAAALYAPMFMLYSVYDGAQDKAEAVLLADRCIERWLQDAQA